MTFKESWLCGFLADVCQNVGFAQKFTAKRLKSRSW